MTEILSSPELQTAISSIVIAIVGAAATAVAQAIRKFLTSRFNESQLSILNEVVRAAVYAAEQGQLAGIVTDKKAAALRFATDILSNAGISVDPDALSAAIEAAVATELNRPVILDNAYRKAEEAQAASLAARLADATNAV